MPTSPVVRVAVCEPESQFTAALERAFIDQPEMDILWRPYATDLLDISRGTQLDIVVLVLKCNDEGLTLVRSIRETSPHSHLVCLVEDLFDEWEWTVRELGADVVYPDIIAKEEFICSVQKLAARPTRR